MYQGKIIEQGSVEQVLFKPKHAYTKKLISAVPVLKHKGQVQIKRDTC
jgi:oligopeptide/dipeptide ABC transporter ATP-binding protein